jgi:hypothetical protein
VKNARFQLWNCGASNKPRNISKIRDCTPQKHNPEHTKTRQEAATLNAQ